MLPVVKDTDGIRESAQRGGALVMLRTLVACLVVGAMSIVFAVSFAAIVYIGLTKEVIDVGVRGGGSTRSARAIPCIRRR